MNIFEAFRTAATTPAPNSGAPNPQTQAPAGAAGNPSVPSGATPLNQPGGPAALPGVATVDDKTKSPLSGFEDLWKPNPDAKVPGSVVPSFAIDSKALDAAVSKMDFAGAISPELAKKAMDGDAASFAEAINIAARTAFSQSTQATSRIVQTAVEQTVANMKKDMLPGMLKDHSIATHVAAENPILQNPAVAPIADVLRMQITAKNPNASAAEVNTQIGQYLAGFADMVVKANIGRSSNSDEGQQQLVSRKSGGKSDNWEDFFGVGAG